MRYHKIINDMVARDTAVMPIGLPKTHCTSGILSEIAVIKTIPPDITAAIFICQALRTNLILSAGSIVSPIRNIAAMKPHSDTVKNPMLTENQLSQLEI